MQRLEVSGAVRPIYGSLGVKRFNLLSMIMPKYFIVSSCCSLLLRKISKSRLFLGFFLVITITLDFWSLQLILLFRDPDCTHWSVTYSHLLILHRHLVTIASIARTVFVCLFTCLFSRVTCKQACLC